MGRSHFGSRIVPSSTIFNFFEAATGLAAMKKSMKTKKHAAVPADMKAMKTKKHAAAPAARKGGKPKKQQNVFFFKNSWCESYDAEGGVWSCEVTQDRGPVGRVYENWVWRRINPR